MSLDPPLQDDANPPPPEDRSEPGEEAPASQRGVPTSHEHPPLVRAGGRSGASARRARFTLYTVEDLLQLPPPAWLLERHIPENSLVVLYGPPGSGKSFLTIAWEMAIALGVPWLGCATRRGAVVHVTAEGGGATLAQRVQAYRDAHELTGSIDLLFVREPVNLLEGDEATLLADMDAWLDEHGTPSSGIPEHPGLVGFETMARMMPGGDENSAQDIGRVIAAADRIRQRTGGTVLLQHHTGKVGELERGSSALRGAADAMFLLTNEDGILTLTCTKQRDAAAVEPRKLRLVTVQLEKRGASCVVEPLDGARPRTDLTSSARTLLQTLRDLQVDGGVAATAWIRASKVPERSAYRAIGDELLAGLYVSREKKRYRLTPLGEIAANGTAHTCEAR